jgi:hypothetical protein
MSVMYLLLLFEKHGLPMDGCGPSFDAHEPVIGRSPSRILSPPCYSRRAEVVQLENYFNLLRIVHSQLLGDGDDQVQMGDDFR